MQLMEYLHADANSVTIENVVELYILADMYQVTGLKPACFSILERVLCDNNAL